MEKIRQQIHEHILHTRICMLHMDDCGSGKRYRVFDEQDALSRHRNELLFHRRVHRETYAILMAIDGDISLAIRCAELVQELHRLSDTAKYRVKDPRDPSIEVAFKELETLGELLTAEGQ